LLFGYPEMMRPPIGIVVKRFPKLSETFILSEILALESLGWPVTIFTLEPPSDDISHGDVSRVRACVLPIDPGRADVHLADRIRFGGIAHLHAHFAGAPTAIARVAARRAGVGFSVSAHAKDIYLTPDEDLRANLTDAKFVVTCTAHNADHLRRVAPGIPVAKLYHGVDCQRLFPPPARLKVTPPLILSVGRLRAKKGFDTLVEACGLLRDRGNVFACDIVGYGPEEFALQRLIDTLKLNQQVRLRGKMSHEDVLDRMRSARIFTLPCRVDVDGDRDGIPNVILEAMAMGVPVVSTSVSGVPEVIEHDQNGILIPPDNPSLLADAIERLISERSHANSLADAARTTVVSRFGEGRDSRTLDLLLQGATCKKPSGIGYVVKGFPRLSESFISNEVLKLERLGTRLCVFSCGRGDSLAAPVFTEMTSPLTYLPSAGSWCRPMLRLTRDCSGGGPALMCIRCGKRSCLRGNIDFGSIAAPSAHSSSNLPKPGRLPRRYHDRA
jgi:glycosyltransferase involved in cell wall biosynthesis